MNAEAGIGPSVGELVLRPNESLAGHTTFRIGGPAQWFATAYRAVELESAVRWARDREIPVRIIGAGTNLLVADSGVRGLVIENRMANCRVNLPNTVVVAGCGAMIADLATWTCHRGLAGLEWAVGIPGTLGGAIVGNAGAFGGYVSDIVRSVATLGASGARQVLSAADCGFAYRDSRFKQAGSARDILLEAELTLSAGDPKGIRARVQEYMNRREASQPWQPCAGSVFKRSSEHPAGWLIEQVGLKGARVGGARISPKHANFIINVGDATAADVLNLIDMVRSEVWKRFSVQLELEVEYVS